MKKHSQNTTLSQIQSRYILSLLFIATMMLGFQFYNPKPKSKKQVVTKTKETIQVHRFFSETSFWNQPLHENAKIDPENAHFLELLKKEPNGPFFKINLVAWTIPVYEVNDSTPRYKIQLHQLSAAEKKR